MKKEEIIENIKFCIELEGDGGFSQFSYDDKTEMMKFLDSCLCESEVKSESEVKYRKFRDASEVLEAIEEHGDWVRLSNGAISRIVYIDNNVVRLGNISIWVYNDNSPSSAVDFTFLDGTPFEKRIK